jgi:hypothetical protein
MHGTVQAHLLADPHKLVAAEIAQTINTVGKPDKTYFETHLPHWAAADLNCILSVLQAAPGFLGLADSATALTSSLPGVLPPTQIKEIWSRC